MLLALILGQSRASVNADLVPPFYSSDTREIGVWSFGGAAVVHRDHVVLAPPMQYHRGSAWSAAKIPPGNLSLQIEFGISEGSGGGSFATWFVDNFTDTESSSSKVALHGLIDQQTVRFTLVENGVQRLDFSAEIFDSRVILYYAISYTSLLIATVHGVTGDFTEVGNQQLNTDLQNHFIGVTAESSEYTSLITLKSVTFHLSDDRCNFEISSKCGAVGLVEHFEPQVSHRLRNPAFFSMRTEILQFEKVRGILNEVTDPTNVDNVLNVIHELNQVSYDVASFNDLNTFIRVTMIPYTQSWSKRTLQILNYVENAKTTTLYACSFAKQIAVEFGAMQNLSIGKTEMKRNELARELAERLQEDHFLDPEMMLTGFVAQYLTFSVFFVCFIELFTVLCFIGVQSCRDFYRRL
jgi:hypothetical protein